MTGGESCASCASCKHDKHPEIIGAEVLTCVWGPPGMVAINVPTPQGLQVQIITRFPTVKAEMGCRQYAPHPQMSLSLPDRRPDPLPNPA